MIAALRKAFDTMVKDKAFLDKAKHRKLSLRPASSTAVEKLVANVMGAKAPVIDRLRQLMLIRGGARCQDYTDKKFCRKKRKRGKKK